MDNDIRPLLIDGEPICSGEKCPASVKIHEPSPYSWCYCRSDELACVEPGELCVPGLRRLLAEAREERDAARREVCRLLDEDPSARWAHSPEVIAADYGWSYLYAPTQGGGEKGGVE